ncbi:hypothetical protein F4679DRAFT_562648 [Xylaria curta]|nr:hypothetical protein F4679DRAFT_562648 [Xylaria curta]
MYEKAPFWAHQSLPLIARTSPQTLYVSEAMRDAFATYQFYCHMYHALQYRNIRTFEHRAPRHELFQDTLLHDFCAILDPVELDEFRSILWYVSTLWAVMLDEYDYWSHIPAWSRTDILCHLCSSGLVFLRKHLVAQQEERIDWIRKLLQDMPKPALSDATIQFSRDRRPFAPMDRSKGYAMTNNLTPVQQSHAPNPISFNFQLQLRATAWVFLNSRLVHDRKHKPADKCCASISGPIPDLNALNYYPLYQCRYLNSSPACYGGMHPTFIYY